MQIQPIPYKKWEKKNNSRYHILFCFVRSVCIWTILHLHVTCHAISYITRKTKLNEAKKEFLNERKKNINYIIIILVELWIRLFFDFTISKKKKNSNNY